MQNHSTYQKVRLYAPVRLTSSNAQSMSSKNIVIVYLSQTNNTKTIGEIIHANVGGTLVALELEKP